MAKRKIGFFVYDVLREVGNKPLEQIKDGVLVVLPNGTEIKIERHGSTIRIYKRHGKAGESEQITVSPMCSNVIFVS